MTRLDHEGSKETIFEMVEEGKENLIRFLTRDQQTTIISHPPLRILGGHHLKNTLKLSPEK